MKENWHNILLSTGLLTLLLSANGCLHRKKPTFVMKTIITESAQEDTYETGCDSVAPENFGSMIEEASTEYGINPKAVAVTVYTESNCDPAAVGGAGEIGLGQIMPSVWVNKLVAEGIIRNKKDLFDPRKNVRATAYILSTCKRKHSPSPARTFSCYNGSGELAKRYAAKQMKKYKRIWNEEPQI